MFGKILAEEMHAAGFKLCTADRKVFSIFTEKSLGQFWNSVKNYKTVVIVYF